VLLKAEALEKNADLGYGDGGSMAPPDAMAMAEPAAQAGLRGMELKGAATRRLLVAKRKISALRAAGQPVPGWGAMAIDPKMSDVSRAASRANHVQHMRGPRKPAEDFGKDEESAEPTKTGKRAEGLQQAASRYRSASKESPNRFHATVPRAHALESAADRADLVDARRSMKKDEPLQLVRVKKQGTMTPRPRTVGGGMAQSRTSSDWAPGTVLGGSKRGGLATANLNAAPTRPWEKGEMAKKTPPDVSEKVVHELKDEYGHDEEGKRRAFATAWKIHNEKLGKAEYGGDYHEHQWPERGHPNFGSARCTQCNQRFQSETHHPGKKVGEATSFGSYSKSPGTAYSFSVEPRETQKAEMVKASYPGYGYVNPDKIRHTVATLRQVARLRDSAPTGTTAATMPTRLVDIAVNRRAGEIDDPHGRATAPQNHLGGFPRKATSAYQSEMGRAAHDVNDPRLIVRARGLGQVRGDLMSKIPGRFAEVRDPDEFGVPPVVAQGGAAARSGHLIGRTGPVDRPSARPRQLPLSRKSEGVQKTDVAAIAHGVSSMVPAATAALTGAVHALKMRAKARGVVKAEYATGTIDKEQADGAVLPGDKPAKRVGAESGSGGDVEKGKLAKAGEANDNGRPVVSWKQYKCQNCGHLDNFSTNHSGSVTGHCKGCSWKGKTFEGPGKSPGHTGYDGTTHHVFDLVGPAKFGGDTQKGELQKDAADVAFGVGRPSRIPMAPPKNPGMTPDRPGTGKPALYHGSVSSDASNLAADKKAAGVGILNSLISRFRGIGKKGWSAPSNHVSQAGAVRAMGTRMAMAEDGPSDKTKTLFEKEPKKRDVLPRGAYPSNATARPGHGGACSECGVVGHRPSEHTKKAESDPGKVKPCDGCGKPAAGKDETLCPSCKKVGEGKRYDKPMAKSDPGDPVYQTTAGFKVGGKWQTKTWRHGEKDHAKATAAHAKLLGAEDTEEAESHFKVPKEHGRLALTKSSGQRDPIAVGGPGYSSTPRPPEHELASNLPESKFTKETFNPQAHEAFAVRGMSHHLGVRDRQSKRSLGFIAADELGHPDARSFHRASLTKAGPTPAGPAATPKTIASPTPTPPKGPSGPKMKTTGGAGAA